MENRKNGKGTLTIIRKLALYLSSTIAINIILDLTNPLTITLVAIAMLTLIDPFNFDTHKMKEVK
jgi:hypothetical protein